MTIWCQILIPEIRYSGKMQIYLFTHDAQDGISISNEVTTDLKNLSATVSDMYACFLLFPSR